MAERTPTSRALWLIFGVGIMLRIYVLLFDPLLSTDIFRYIWDGRVQAAGINPYRYFPAHDALAHLRDAVIFPRINRADYAVTIYPPVAEFFFLMVTRIGENVNVMRLALLGCEAVIVTLDRTVPASHGTANHSRGCIFLASPSDLGDCQ